MREIQLVVLVAVLGFLLSLASNATTEYLLQNEKLKADLQMLEQIEQARRTTAAYKESNVNLTSISN